MTNHRRCDLNNFILGFCWLRICYVCHIHHKITCWFFIDYQLLWFVVDDYTTTMNDGVRTSNDGAAIDPVITGASNSFLETTRKWKGNLAIAYLPKFHGYIWKCETNHCHSYANLWFIVTFHERWPFLWLVKLLEKLLKVNQLRHHLRYHHEKQIFAASFDR